MPTNSNRADSANNKPRPKPERWPTILEKQIATKGEMTEHENLLRRDIEGLRVELKSDIEALRVELKHDIEALRVESKRDLREVELRLEARLADTKADLTRWVVGAGVLQTTLIIGVLMKVARLI